ncbi:hypothetical protein [Streptomyces sp. NPDC101234]
MTLSIAAVCARGWRESDLAFGLREGTTILIAARHWSAGKRGDSSTLWK